MAGTKNAKGKKAPAQPDLTGLDAAAYREIFTTGCSNQVDIAKSVRAVAYLLDFLSESGNTDVSGWTCLGLSKALHGIADNIQRIRVAEGEA